MDYSPTPIFVLSLPRSGSTLIQRVIASHPDVSTVAEPWLQLPLTSILRDNHIFTDYSHATCRRAVKELIERLPNKEQDIYSGLRNFSLDIYSKLNNENTRFFLDKTPRYHLICHLLPNIFPKGKFIILWRNPLAIVSSLVETFGDGEWMIHRHKVDLYKGLDKLYNFYYTNDNSISTNYESLVGTNSINEWKKIFNYLELEFNSRYLKKFTNVSIEGSLGDPKRNKFKNIKDTSDKWKETYTNFYRVRWAHKYLKWIGTDRLSNMDYQYKELKNEIPTNIFDSNLVNDTKGIAISYIKDWFEPFIFKSKVKYSSWERFGHT